MMRGNKLFGSGLLLVFALLLAAIPASASAKAALLQFNEESGPAKNGAPAVSTINIGQECAAKSEGTVVETPAKNVVVKAPTPKSTSCSKAGVSDSGRVEETTWSSKGKLKIKAAVEIKYATGPCVYAFTKYTTPQLTFPGYTFVKGETTGKLNKTASSKTKGACEKTLTKQYSLSILDQEEESFETVLT
jgi:hypothetical protein